MTASVWVVESAIDDDEDMRVDLVAVSPEAAVIALQAEHGQERVAWTALEQVMTTYRRRPVVPATWQVTAQFAARGSRSAHQRTYEITEWPLSGA